MIRIFKYIHEIQWLPSTLDWLIVSDFLSAQSNKCIACFYGKCWNTWETVAGDPLALWQWLCPGMEQAISSIISVYAVRVLLNGRAHASASDAFQRERERKSSSDSKRQIRNDFKICSEINQPLEPRDGYVMAGIRGAAGPGPSQDATVVWDQMICRENFMAYNIISLVHDIMRCHMSIAEKHSIRYDI